MLIIFLFCLLLSRTRHHQALHLSVSHLAGGRHARHLGAGARLSRAQRGGQLVHLHLHRARDAPAHRQVCSVYHRQRLAVYVAQLGAHLSRLATSGHQGGHVLKRTLGGEEVLDDDGGGGDGDGDAEEEEEGHVLISKWCEYFTLLLLPSTNKRCN